MQTIKAQVSDLLNKQMDRQEFLRSVGVGLVTLVGLSTVLRFLSPEFRQNIDNGYGSSTYGGSEDGALRR